MLVLFHRVIELFELKGIKSAQESAYPPSGPTKIYVFPDLGTMI